MILRCNDPRCTASGHCSTVASVEDGILVIVAKHHGESGHITRVPIAALTSLAEPIAIR